MKITLLDGANSARVVGNGQEWEIALDAELFVEGIEGGCQVDASDTGQSLTLQFRVARAGADENASMSTGHQETLDRRSARTSSNVVCSSNERLADPSQFTHQRTERARTANGIDRQTRREGPSTGETDQRTRKAIRTETIDGEGTVCGFHGGSGSVREGEGSMAIGETEGKGDLLRQGKRKREGEGTGKG